MATYVSPDAPSMTVSVEGMIGGVRFVDGVLTTTDKRVIAVLNKLGFAKGKAPAAPAKQPEGDAPADKVETTDEVPTEPDGEDAAEGDEPEEPSKAPIQRRNPK